MPDYYKLWMELRAEIERLLGDLQEARLQRDAKLASQTAVNEAAQREIERLTAKIADLRLSRKFFQEYCDEKDERIAKLQAVVDAAKVMRENEYVESEIRLELDLDKALAALEEDNDSL